MARFMINGTEYVIVMEDKPEYTIFRRNIP